MPGGFFFSRARFHLIYLEKGHLCVIDHRISCIMGCVSSTSSETSKLIALLENRIMDTRESLFVAASLLERASNGVETLAEETTSIASALDSQADDVLRTAGELQENATTADATRLREDLKAQTDSLRSTRDALNATRAKLQLKRGEMNQQIRDVQRHKARLDILESQKNIEELRRDLLRA